MEPMKTHSKRLKTHICLHAMKKNQPLPMKRIGNIIAQIKRLKANSRKRSTDTHTHTHLPPPRVCCCLNIPQNSLTVAALLPGNQATDSVIRGVREPTSSREVDTNLSSASEVHTPAVIPAAASGILQLSASSPPPPPSWNFVILQTHLLIGRGRARYWTSGLKKQLSSACFISTGIDGASLPARLT